MERLVEAIKNEEVKIGVTLNPISTSKTDNDKRKLVVNYIVPQYQLDLLSIPYKKEEIVCGNYIVMDSEIALISVKDNFDKLREDAKNIGYNQLCSCNIVDQNDEDMLPQRIEEIKDYVVKPVAIVIPTDSGYMNETMRTAYSSDKDFRDFIDNMTTRKLWKEVVKSGNTPICMAFEEFAEAEL